MVAMLAPGSLPLWGEAFCLIARFGAESEFSVLNSVESCVSRFALAAISASAQ
jgi:hypothetical protein